MIDRSRIGFRTAPTTAAVDGWRVKLFCQAIGETDAVYFDPAVARATGTELVSGTARVAASATVGKALT